MKRLYMIMAAVVLFGVGAARADTNLARSCYAPNAATTYSFTTGNDCPADQKGWEKPVDDTAVLSTTSGPVTWDNPDSKYRRFADVPAGGQVTACASNIAAGKNASATSDLCTGLRSSIAKGSINATVTVPVSIGSSAVITWSPPPADGITLDGYNVYQNSVRLGSTAPTSRTYSIANLQPGTYTFAVSAFNSAGESGKASKQATVSQPILLPGMPTNMQVTITVQVPGP